MKVRLKNNDFLSLENVYFWEAETVVLR